MSVAIACLVAFMLLSLLCKCLPDDPIQDEIDDLERDIKDLQADEPVNYFAIKVYLERIRWLEEQRVIERERKPNSRYPTVQQRGSLTNT